MSDDIDNGICSTDRGGGAVMTSRWIEDRVRRRWEQLASEGKGNEGRLEDCLRELGMRLCHPPFESELLGWFSFEGEARYHRLGEAAMVEAEPEWESLNRASRLRQQGTLELSSAPEGQRWTAGLLPVLDYVLLILRQQYVEPSTEASAYGIDTYFFRAVLLQFLDVMEGIVRIDRTRVDFERELDAFRAMLPELMQTHEGKFVAVGQGELVGEDDDEFDLARRVHDAYPKQFVLIRRVTEEEPGVASLDSLEGAPL